MASAATETTLVHQATNALSSLLLESERAQSAAAAGHDKYNMATFMVLFLIVTIEVMLVKVVTAEAEQRAADEQHHNSADGNHHNTDDTYEADGFTISAAAAFRASLFDPMDDDPF
ncbi:hypothetical protein QAD02_008820 [Eretmocerus hayati]|uniref:Uncharacterized protein n=1 Tax=Eretmocerus hayati TaxID=131215 RepID=A0ACC2N8V4_9HYME|nr:hypothetical protein QAD02_008820 [Eretmocerus hayati]